MVLPTDLFDNILKSLIKGDPFDGDKRAVRRFGISAQVRITTGLGQSPDRYEVVRIRDISKLGIGLLVKKAMRVGQSFVLELERKGAPAAHILCKVERRQQIDRDLFIVGAVFVRHLEHDIAPLPADALGGGVHDRAGYASVAR